MRLATSSLIIATGASATYAIDGGVAAVMGGIVTVVGVTLMVVSWIDKRIDHKIRNHANLERAQYATILREISNLRELSGHPPLDVAGILKETA